MSDQGHKAIVAAETLPVSRPMHPMAEAILARNPTPETLRELMTLQREWEKDLAKRAFTEALVALKRDLPSSITRDKKADMGAGRPKYTFASLANVTNEITPHLTNHGFAVSTPATTSPDPKTGVMVVTVTATLTHHAGHSEQTTLSGPVDNSGAKSQIQGIGASITYLQRYSVLSLLGLATDDMQEPEAGAAKVKGEDQVDTQRNLKALSFLMSKHKMTKAEIERVAGRPVSEWALSDLDLLRTWVPNPEAETGREPGQDDDAGDLLMSCCPDCTFRTDHPETYDGHLLETGHGQKSRTTKTKKL